MAKHDVGFEIPSMDLGKAAVSFSVKKDGKKIGTLKASKGSVVWVPVDHSYGHKIGWAELGELIETHGKKED